MAKFYSFFVMVFTTKISAILGFGAICFLGISISALITFTYSDPSLLIPGIQTVSADLSMPPVMVHAAAAEQQPVNAEKEIYVSLKDQTLVYMEGNQIIGEFKISSGLPGTPTPPGEYTVLKKKPIVDYKGATYDFANTKWNLMFKTGPLNYYIHGAFWHHNFGHPMSHGCVNVSYADMEGLYNWADEGTKIVIVQDSLDRLQLMNANIYPTPPGSVIASRITDNSLTISWNAASDPAGVAGYQIYQNNFLIATTSAPKYEASGLDPQTLYRFAIFSYNQSGSASVQSEGLSVMTKQQIGLNPNLTPSPVPAPTPILSPGSSSQPILSANTYTVTVDNLGNISPAVLSIKVNDTVNFVYPNPGQTVVLKFNPISQGNDALDHGFSLQSYKFILSGTYTYKAKDYNGNSASITVN